MRKIVQVVGLLALVVSFAACDKKKDDRPADNFNRKALLTYAADSIIIPAYAHFNSAFGEMKVGAQAFTATPGAASLAALREKWKKAYMAWQQVELFHFGPADDVLLRNYFNIYPTDVPLLLSYINTGNYNLEELANNKVQGFPAMDYLLNGSGSTDADILAHFSTSADAAKWKKYLNDVVNSMDAKINVVVMAWNGSYRNHFINNDGTGAGSSLSLMVNEYIMNFERFLRSGKFGIPAGVMSGTPAPEKVEAYYSHEMGRDLALASLHASRDLFMGRSFITDSTGPSLYTYIQALATNNPNLAPLANAIRDQFNEIENQINSLGPSIYDAIGNNRTGVLAVYDAFQQQVRYLKVDMASAIGITISYTDNDGD